ncbi:MAG: hypothetical protein ACOC35_11340 [Promethearchaeia archaeon]
MIQPQNSININNEDLQKKNVNKSARCQVKSLSKYWKSDRYSTLLNNRELKKAARRDVWQLKVKQMLQGFMQNMEELNQVLKFKMSGKVLNSSTYLLKSKTHSIINSSEETQEEIDEAQQVEEQPIVNFKEGELENNVQEQMIYTGKDMMTQGEMLPEENIFDDEEILGAFEELEEENLLDEDQVEAFHEAKAQHVLNMDPHKLTKKIEKSKNLIEPPPKFIYKKVQFHDLANALNEVLNKPKKKKKKKKDKEKKIDKDKIPFLPDNFISKAEEKRQNFEEQIDDFYAHLQQNFSGEPLGFLKLVKQTNQEINVKAIVNTLLIVLHLINHKKVELWKSYVKEETELKERASEDDGSNIYLSPKSQNKSREKEK